MKRDLLKDLREGAQLSRKEQIRLIMQLSLPAIMAQLSHIVMQYIDAAMVGRLGSAQSASIGLMSSSTWLLSSLCTAAVTGFTVQVAQQIGARKERTARDVMKQGFVFALSFAVLLGGGAAMLSSWLVSWLGADASIAADARDYILVYALSLPFVQLNNLSGGMLQASSNMRVPSILQTLMCFLDVVFNALLIFPETVFLGIRIPGAGLGVLGAALGTALAQAVTALMMFFFLVLRSPMLRIRRGEGFSFQRNVSAGAMRIALPIAAERLIMCSAYIMATRIVAPLGTIAIAANSFGVTAESLCYMPGYGIAAAATTLIGQSIGAKRDELTPRLGALTVALGMIIMTFSGALMFVFAPLMIGVMSPDPQVVALGARVLRIEAFAEPLFAASIVAAGVFRGAGDTLVASVINFVSMWGVRLPISALLAPRIGLVGVWIAMALDLSVSGILFLIRMRSKRWLPKK